LNIPNNPSSALASHPRSTLPSAEIRQKSQTPFVLYLSLGKVSIAFFGMKDHSFSRAVGQLNQIGADFAEGFPKQSLML